jgi:hypothetical protein
MGTPNKFAQALRDTVIPMVSRLAPFQHAFVQRLSELDIAYHGSPIVEGPGKRYVDDSMRGGKGISSRFLVVIGDDTESSTRQAAKQLCESFSDIVELRSSRHPGMMLVRPDGYIAYATHSRAESVPWRPCGRFWNARRLSHTYIRQSGRTPTRASGPCSTPPDLSPHPVGRRAAVAGHRCTAGPHFRTGPWLGPPT